MSQSNLVTPAKTWLGRVHNFDRQMFPFFPNVVIFVLQFCVNYLILNQLFFRGTSSLTSSQGLDIALGSASLVMFVYLFRCFDEVKDYPTDLINFPDRPLVSGVLSLKDIKILQVAVILVLLLTNLTAFSSRDVIFGFGIVLVFTLFASRWFFFEKQIRDSLPLALITHNPVLYLYQVYILSFFTLDLNAIPAGVWLFLIADALPGTAWEISRKIRGRKEEDTYTTYTKIWGIYWPPILVALAMVTSLAMAFFSLLPSVGPLLSYLFLLPLAVLVGFTYMVLSFWRNPDEVPPLRATVETFKFALILVFIAFLVFGPSPGPGSI